MACIKSMAHVSCFQSWLRSLYYLWLDAAQAGFVASAVVTRTRMRCYGHVIVQVSYIPQFSLYVIYTASSLGPLALGCVNSVETCTSV